MAQGQERQAWRWLHHLREVMSSEFDDFACCFESLDEAAPVAWVAVGRLAELTCDVRDGAVVGQLVAGSRVLSKQLFPIEESELPYVKVFAALASLLRAERALIPAVLPSGAATDARDLQWFGGWKYLPSATAVPGAARFVLPRLALRLDASGPRWFNWGGVPAESIERVVERVGSGAPRGPVQRQRVVDDRLVPPRDGYAAAAGAVLDALAGKCEKIVLSRKRILEFSRPLDPVDLFSRVIEQRGHSFQYLMTLAPGETWVGISPELLLRRNGLEIETRPLAGSRRRGSSVADDAKERQSLLTSDKDSREHEIAASLMFRRLQRVCERDTLKVAGERDIAQLTYIQHLATKMTGRLDPAYDAIDALTCICPPATILGKPEVQAEQVLRSCEPFQRSFFTGGLGVMSSNGDCEIALCIRSAFVNGAELHVYAGSGYVAGSIPDDEWRETETKMQPFVEAVDSLLRESGAQDPSSV